MKYHWSVNLAYWVEVKAGEMWELLSRKSGGVTAGRVTDRLVTYPYLLRKHQERKHPVKER